MRKFVSATIAAALCMLSAGPGAAQDYRFSGFDAPRGATATLNLRVPLGTTRQQTDRRMSYGLTLGYGQTVGAPALDGRTTTRAVNFADLRFNNAGELRNARVASFDLANLDRDPRMNLMGGKKSTIWIVGGVIAGGLLACLVLFDCFEDDEGNNTTGNNTQ